MTLLQVIKCHSSGKYFLVTIKILDNTMHLILKNGIPSQSPQLLVVRTTSHRVDMGTTKLTWPVIRLWARTILRLRISIRADHTKSRTLTIRPIPIRWKGAKVRQLDSSTWKRRNGQWWMLRWLQLKSTPTYYGT